MISNMDHYVGELIKTLEQTGLNDNTWIFFTSDHGDHMGERNLW